MSTYVQLALYPDPDEHFAYVACAVQDPPWMPMLYRVVCPADGCHTFDSRLFNTFGFAWDHALAHRRELLEDWLQPSIPRD